MDKKSNFDFIVEHLYELLKQYSPREIEAAYQYCLKHPEDKTVAIASISKRLTLLDAPDSDICDVHINNHETGTISELTIPKDQAQSFIDGLLSHGYRPLYDTRGDIETEYSLYYSLKVPRNEYT